MIGGILAFFAVVLLALSSIGRSAPPATNPTPLPPALPNTQTQPQAQAPAAQQPQPANTDMTTTASGLQYSDSVVGMGAQPKAGQTVIVHYTGFFDSGQIFDSSVQRNQPFEFVLGAGQVIRGWDEGIASMKVGGKRKLIVPPQLAYGDRGSSGVIPPNARLTFDVELIGIK